MRFWPGSSGCLPSGDGFTNTPEHIWFVPVKGSRFCTPLEPLPVWEVQGHLNLFDLLEFLLVSPLRGRVRLAHSGAAAQAEPPLTFIAQLIRDDKRA